MKENLLYNNMKKYTAPILVLLAGSFWGCMGLLVRLLSGYGMDSLEIAVVRVSVSSIFMVVGTLLFNRSLLKINWKDIWCFVGTGICSLAVFSASYFKTMTMTSLSVAAVLLYTAPAFVTIMSFFLFKEQINKQKILALVLAFLGCVLVTGLLSEKPVLSGMGIVFGLISGFGYALYSIFSRFAMQRGYNSITITVYTFLFCTIGLLPFIKFNHFSACLAGKGNMALWIIFLTFMVTVAPYLCYTKGLEGMENGRASVIASIEPVVATLVGMIVFGETNYWFTWIGIAMVLGSIAMISIEKPQIKAR